MKNNKNSAAVADVKVDAFGAKVGSRKAEINALLSPDKAKTVAAIRAEGGIPGNYRDYLDELAARGLVKGDHENGWVLASKDAAPKKGRRKKAEEPKS